MLFYIELMYTWMP